MAALDGRTHESKIIEIEFINNCKANIGKHAYIPSSGENYLTVSVSL